MLSNSITYIFLDYAHFLGYIKKKYSNKTQTVSEKKHPLYGQKRH